MWFVRRAHIGVLEKEICVGMFEPLRKNSETCHHSGFSQRVVKQGQAGVAMWARTAACLRILSAVGAPAWAAAVREIMVLSLLQAPCLFLVKQTGPFMRQEESGGGGLMGWRDGWKDWRGGAEALASGTEQCHTVTVHVLADGRQHFMPCFVSVYQPEYGYACVSMLLPTRWSRWT